MTGKMRAPDSLPSFASDLPCYMRILAITVVRSEAGYIWCQSARRNGVHERKERERRNPEGSEALRELLPRIPTCALH